ncbi:MAG: PqqD family protein [Deltaproteobacteria bacterium]|nr:PqqD family protein [Deltaproteobacteria bacterium]
MDMDLNALFRKREEIVTRRIAGETLLVPISGSLANMERIFTLDSVAEYVWQELDGETSLEAIRDGVLAHFNVEKEQATADLQEFITQLVEADLIAEAT